MREPLPAAGLGNLNTESRPQAPRAVCPSRRTNLLAGAARLLDEGVIERMVFEYHPQRMPDAADAESGLAWLEGLQGYACVPCGTQTAAFRATGPMPVAEFAARYLRGLRDSRIPSGRVVNKFYDDIACGRRRRIPT